MSQYQNSVDVLVGHIYNEDITGRKQDDAIGILADKASDFMHEGFNAFLHLNLPEIVSACRLNNAGLTVRFSFHIQTETDEAYGCSPETETPCYAVIPDPD